MLHNFTIPYYIICYITLFHDTTETIIHPMDINATYILSIVEQRIADDPHCNQFNIECLPDMVFDKKLIIKNISSQEGWNENFSFNYFSDLKWNSVKDEFSRERKGHIVIVKNKV